MRGDQLSRQWRILRQIETSRNGLSAGEIADLGNVSLRTAYRDLDDLQIAGFPLYAQKGDGGQRWTFIDTYRFKIPYPFTFTELMSLHISKDFLRLFKNTVFFESLESIFKKVQSSLPPQTIEYLDRIQSTFHTGIGPYKDYAKFREIINKVNQAALENRCIEILYKSLRRKKEALRQIDPYRIWFFEGTIYIIGFCHLRNEIRTFVVDRIKLLRLTDDKFKIPEDFDIDEFTRHSFKVMQDDLHVVKIRITPAWARYIGERIWHESQEIQKLPDGSMELTFRVAGLDEIKQWIMSLGPEAYVLEPERLKHLVRDGLQNTLAQYERETPVFSKADIKKQQRDMFH